MGIGDWLGIGKGIADTAGELTKGAANIVTAAKTDPNRAVDAEVEQLRIQTEERLEELVNRSVESARDWSLEYEGRASDIPPWLRVVRSLIRPAFSVFFFGLIVTVVGIDLVAFVRGVDGEPFALTRSIPEPVWVLCGIVLTFWFGGKVVERSKVGKA